MMAGLAHRAEDDAEVPDHQAGIQVADPAEKVLFVQPDADAAEGQRAYLGEQHSDGRSPGAGRLL